jgi:hypothetical protein
MIVKFSKFIFFVCVIFVVNSSKALATSLPQSKVEFCGRFNQSGELTDDILELSVDPTNLMSFKNNGGLFNGGVCWWHSRFQRNALYLTIFRPDHKIPPIFELKRIIRDIRDGLKIVTIDGFHNFNEFTEVYRDLIQHELNSWQLFDGIILGKWIDGLSGTTTTRPEILKEYMDSLFDYVSAKKKIAYQKLQIKGITSHAWLVIGTSKNSVGMEIGYIDSNSPNMSQNYTYLYGDTSFYTKSYGQFVPYLEFKREENRLLSIAKNFCFPQKKFASNNFSKDYDLDLIEASR